MKPKKSSMLFVSLFCTVLFVSAALMAQTKLPGGVTSRVKKINGYLDKTESRLKSGSSDRNDLDRAREELNTIKKNYPDFASHGDVAAAEMRLAQMEKAFNEAQTGKKNKLIQNQKDEAAQDRVYEDWAGRLSKYKTDTKAGSPGNFGASTEDVKTLLANRKNYEDAKSVYAGFLKTGIDKDSHFRLRQAEYDIKVAIMNYESSRERIPVKAEEMLNEAISWMKDQKKKKSALSLDKDQKKNIDVYVENSNRLFPDTDRIRKLNELKAALDGMVEDADRSILENRRMKPAQYKGKDSAELESMAKNTVLKSTAGAEILRVHITSPGWTTESALEWTDTTRTALQGRVTEGIYAQVSARTGRDCYLYTLFLNKETVNGVRKPLTGHVMYKERILEKNAR
jgi:hypothetical protein